MAHVRVSAGPWKCQFCGIVVEKIPEDWVLISACRTVRLFRAAQQIHSLISIQVGRKTAAAQPQEKKQCTTNLQ